MSESRRVRALGFDSPGGNPAGPFGPRAAFVGSRVWKRVHPLLFGLPVSVECWPSASFGGWLVGLASGG